MDRERHDLGLDIRKEVVGATYVEKATAAAGDFGAEFQEMVNEYCWGNIWGRGVLSRRERSILVLGMTAALGRTPEFETHFCGAVRNGMSLEELKQVLLQIAVYCGVPAGVESFRAAARAIERMEAETEEA